MKMRIFALLTACSIASSAEQAIRIRIWHQLMYSHRPVQAQLIQQFESENPGITIESTYLETEELRSKFQASALGGIGPEIVYGPSDQVGPFYTMGLLQDLNGLFTTSELQDFAPASLVYRDGKIEMIGDTVGNHLSLIYNKDLLARPPQNTNELWSMGKAWKQNYFLVWPMQEPFFFAPWAAGFGTPFVDGQAHPQLNSKAMSEAFEFIKALRNSSFVPKEADYETANALFKDRKSAMIINGDWSWGDYKKAGINFGVAPLPMISSTGLWPAPLVSTLGYSINKNTDPKDQQAVYKFLRFMLTKTSQLRFAEEVQTLPSRLSARQSPVVTGNPLLLASTKIMQLGQPMPVDPELRAIWDTLRSHYQAVLADQETPELAGSNAQKAALEQIAVMNRVEVASMQAWLVKILMALLVVGLFYFAVRWFKAIIKDCQQQSTFAYYLLLPSLLAVVIVVIFPFAYNLYISFSNLSLRTFHDSQVIGWQNYIQILQDPQFYAVFVKTILWTISNVFAHVVLGVFLALLLNQTLPAKPLFRVLLIIPWAVPQYITALTWRGLFNSQFGLIDKVIHDLLHGPAIEWFSSPLKAFSACLLTNIWLGFPFMMMVTLGGLQSIPKELYEAAKVDGASSLQTFRRITWPLLQSVLKPAIILGCIWTFNNLNVIWLVSNGGEPADQTHILVSYVYKSAFELYRYSSSAALSMIIFVVLLAWTIFYLRVQDPSSKRELS